MYAKGIVLCGKKSYSDACKHGLKQSCFFILIQARVFLQKTSKKKKNIYQTEASAGKLLREDNLMTKKCHQDKDKL